MCAMASEPTHSEGGPALRVVMMPRDTNPQGTIFGGILLSYIDQAGAVAARAYQPHRFVTVAMDQVVNQVAKARSMSGGKANVPLTIRLVNGAPGSAAAQHSQSPEAWFMNVPGLKIVIPATPYDAKGLLKTAIRGEDPVLFFEHKNLYAATGDVPEEDYTLPGPPMDVETYRARIKEASERVKAGEYITQEDLEKEMEQW